MSLQVYCRDGKTLIEHSAHIEATEALRAENERLQHHLAAALKRLDDQHYCAACGHPLLNMEFRHICQSVLEERLEVCATRIRAMQGIIDEQEAEIKRLEERGCCEEAI